MSRIYESIEDEIAFSFLDSGLVLQVQLSMKRRKFKTNHVEENKLKIVTSIIFKDSIIS